MDTLHDRLAALADDAPTGGAPAAELWARGKRAHRLRAAALAATLLVVGAVGTGVGVRLADGDGNRSGIPPAGTVDIALPIDYPVGEELPDLGDTPGPLAAIWVTPRVGGGGPEVVGLVAETGTFGTLPIDVSRRYMAPDSSYFALSPDGRTIAYDTPAGELAVRDLVSGESYSPAFEWKRVEPDYTWVDPTHLVGHDDVNGDGEVTDDEGWVWQPGRAPKAVSIHRDVGLAYTLLGPNAGRLPWFLTLPDDPPECPSRRDVPPGGERTPVLCDVVGVIGPEIALTHDGDEAVVALDIRGVEDPALRQVVATAGAPLRVTFATDLIAEALDLAGGAS